MRIKLKTEAQPMSELDHVRRLVEDIPVKMLTTRDNHGDGVSRPTAALKMDANGAFRFFTATDSAKTRELDAVNLGLADSARATYVSLSAKGEAVNDRAPNEHLWTPFAKPWFPEGPTSPNRSLLRPVPGSDEYRDTSNSETVRLLAMSAPAVRRLGGRASKLAQRVRYATHCRS